MRCALAGDGFGGLLFSFPQQALAQARAEREAQQQKAEQDRKAKRRDTGEQATKKMIPNAKYISYETEQEGVIEVVNGKIDAFIYDMPFNAIAYSQKGAGKIVVAVD